ncbi:hypothetical protein MMC18_009511 [Xylographa bjoerkii]|nr:hypothetical protein [Xylographa bjoerkii]
MFFSSRSWALALSHALLLPICLFHISVSATPTPARDELLARALEVEASGIFLDERQVGGVNIAPISISGVNIPPVKIPPVNIPPVSIPPVTVPGMTIPPISVPTLPPTAPPTGPACKRAPGTSCKLTVEEAIAQMKPPPEGKAVFFAGIQPPQANKWAQQNGMVTVGMALGDLSNPTNPQSPLNGMNPKLARNLFWKPASEAFAQMTPRGGTVTVLLLNPPNHEPPATTIWQEVEKPNLTGEKGGKGPVKDIVMVFPKSKDPKKAYPYWPKMETPGTSGSGETSKSKTKVEKPSTEKPSTEKPSTDTPSTESPSIETPSTKKPATSRPETSKGKATGKTKLILRRLLSHRRSQDRTRARRQWVQALSFA